jgi:hypothetical protein
LPNLPILAADLRYYLAHGVEGVFVQFDPVVQADMRDLKIWVLLKLLEDPARDVGELTAEFLRGFYGPASGPIARYLELLERAAAARPAHVDYPARAEQYRYLTPRFLLEAQSLFDEAERLAAGDATHERRVRFARLALDRATLLRFERELRAGIDPKAVARRYWRTAEEQIDRNLVGKEAARVRELVATEIAETLIDLGYTPPPREPGAGAGP